jgi:hypothetical protein
MTFRNSSTLCLNDSLLVQNRSSFRRGVALLQIIPHRLLKILRKWRTFALSAVLVPALLITVAGSAYAGTFTAFGPKTYVRGTGQPVTVTNTFTVLDPTTAFKLTIANSGISSAVVKLNGAQVFGPSDFNQHVTILSKPVKLLGINQLAVELRSQPGSSFILEIIGVDNVPPTITATASPPPNAAEWNNSNVTVSFTCSDVTSGVATCPPPQPVTTEGANQVISGSATDKAVNTASVSVTLNIDKTAPKVSAVPSPGPNAAGWNNSNVTVSFTCTDTLSGIASCPSSTTVSTEGASQVVSGTAQDRAGNTASTSLTVKLDKTPPAISITSPNNGSSFVTASQTISGIVADTLSGIASVTCNGAPGTLNGATFSCGINLSAGTNLIAAVATDAAGNTSTSNLTLTYALVLQVTIKSPASLAYLNITPTTVNGTVSDPTATVMVNGISAPQSAGQFSVTVPLAEGPNILTATATTSLGTVATASITVTLDTTPPHVTITSPPDQFITTSAAVSVVGNVNDIVVGTVNSQQATVTINGAQAQVSNRTFLAANVPLNLGSNVIQAVATDHAGNAATTQISVTRQAPRAQPQIQLISGNNQSGTIGTVLSAPLVVALADASGNPVANQPVIFKVTQNNGMLSAGGTPAPSAIATTDAQGQAQVNWTLGMRSGAGGNAVEAYAVNFLGTAIFTATGNQGPPGIIVIDSGNTQIGAIGQPLPLPLIAVVVDSGSNRLAGVPVTFTVNAGGGSFGGQSTLTVTTDSDGRAAATLTTGMQEGNSNNLVQADFPSDQSFPATFTASGRVAGSAANTTISGVVLDNSGVPIPGVTIRAALTTVLTSNPAVTQTIPAVQTDAQGQFTIPHAPVGFVKLMADGSTATLPGTYPSLEYDMVTVSGQDNTVGMPIYLLPLNAANQLCVTATTGGGTLTISEAPGFSLTFAPGQVTFPGGSQTGCVIVTVVHGDKVPMVPGFGQQPRFIVTIQPSGALFNPPAPITLPNVDGLAPRSVTEMYSFDHDIGSFVAIGTGTVSDNGQVIRSNPGVGVLKAGWHCGGNPNSIGTAATCPTCMFCQGTQCTSQGNGTACGGTGACQFTGPGQQPTCNCPTGQLLVNNNQCQTPPNCPPGTTFNVSTGQCCGNGQCQTPPNCPPGTTFNVSTGQCCGNGQCYTPPNCPIGTSFNASTGQCCANGQCQTPPNCPPGTTFNVSTGQCCGNGQCQNPPACTPPQVLVNGQCQTPPNCPPGTTFDVSTGQCCGNGQCQCPSGQVSVNGQCTTPHRNWDPAPISSFSLNNYFAPDPLPAVTLVSPSELVLFNVQIDDQDTYTDVPSGQTGQALGEGKLTFTISGGAYWRDPINPASQSPVLVINQLQSGNQIMVVRSEWDGSPISVSCSVVDTAVPVTAPDTGSKTDPQFAINWSFARRTGPCPLNIKASPLDGLFVPNGSTFSEQLGPGPGPSNPTCMNRPCYQNQAILETFEPVTANFTMADLTPEFKNAHPALVTPDQVARSLWNPGNNSTFNPDSNDELHDNYQTFPLNILNSNAGGKVFTDTALAIGVGYSFAQTYSCANVQVAKYLINFRYKGTPVTDVEVKRVAIVGVVP